ncbi:YlbG family protein [Paenibacillus sp. GCM10012307]|uniref:YlbG family protein n=1 Tax=Paenibacillus roseus TaxID=2798579 RepID=A0A934J9V0_9BACL|nr:YlbG family protein [Paenibacillus roseus]
MFSERTGYIIWVNDLKAARSLDKYGNVYYMSRKMHYVVMYMNADRAEDTVRNIQRLPFVKRIERSYRNEIKTEYNSDVPDKTRFYSL